MLFKYLNSSRLIINFFSIFLLSFGLFCGCKTANHSGKVKDIISPGDPSTICNVTYTLDPNSQLSYAIDDVTGKRICMSSTNSDSICIYFTSEEKCPTYQNISGALRLSVGNDNGRGYRPLKYGRHDVGQTLGHTFVLAICSKYRDDRNIDNFDYSSSCDLDLSGEVPKIIVKN